MIICNASINHCLGYKSHHSEAIEAINSDDSEELPWPIPQMGLLSAAHQQLLAPSRPVTPPSLLETVTDLFLPATPSPSSSHGANVQQTASVIPSTVAAPGDGIGSDVLSTTTSTSSRRSLSVDPPWQSVSWYHQPGSSTIASGSSLPISGAFLSLPSAVNGEEEIDIWADDYKVANSDDHIL